MLYHVDPRFRVCDAPEEFERGSDLQAGPERT